MQKSGVDHRLLQSFPRGPVGVTSYIACLSSPTAAISLHCSYMVLLNLSELTLIFMPIPLKGILLMFFENHSSDFYGLQIKFNM